MLVGEESALPDRDRHLLKAAFVNIIRPIA